jgi:alcohol dehydrogenase class IV
MEGGFYYKPTIFTEVNNNMRIAREEIFGPVACVIRFDSEEEAVTIANDSIYGLAGGIFSRNHARAGKIARQIRTGTMWINNYHAFGDFCPFGGYKQSGTGRELGHAGLTEYTQIKRIHVAASADHTSNFTMKLFSDDPKINFVQYYAPTQVLAGHGSLFSLYKEVARLKAKRALIITDVGVCKAGLTQKVTDILAEYCVGIFDQVIQDSDFDTVDAAVKMARELKADIIVSVGGGSVIDTAKVVCVTLKNGGKADDHIALMRLTEPQTPHICIPTTSGTGSEVTNAAVIKSHHAARKVYIIDHYIVPNTAILDPVMTLALPKGLTVSTAMDAMTHAMEALTSTMSNAICEGHALQAIRMINENLPMVIENGDDETARLNMQLAATMAGWAFNIAQVGLAHSMAHTLGMLCNLPHGAACGIVLPAVMRYNAEVAADKLALAAQALGVNTTAMSKKEAALAAADAIEKLMTTVGHPLRLSELNVTEESLTLASLHAIADLPTIFNARPVNDPNDIDILFKQVF